MLRYIEGSNTVEILWFEQILFESLPLQITGVSFQSFILKKIILFNYIYFLKK